MATEVRPASQWRAKRCRAVRSVFHSGFLHYRPHHTASQATFDHRDALEAQRLPTHTSAPHPTATNTASCPLDYSAPQHSLTGDATDSITSAGGRQNWERAWHTVTTRLTLPSSVSGESLSGSLRMHPQSQFQSQQEEAEFNAALRVLLHIRTSETAHAHDILAWYCHQVISHFVQNVPPLLAFVPRPVSPRLQSHADYFSSHLAIVQGAVRTMTAVLALYFSCLSLLARGIDDGQSLLTRLRQHVFALINISTESITPSVRVVLETLVDKILDIPRPGEKNDALYARHCGIEADDARKQLLSLVQVLTTVGLAGECFQVLFAEVMDRKMTEYIQRSFSRIWRKAPPLKPGAHGPDMAAAKSANPAPQSSWCILSLCEWVESRFSHLALETLRRVNCISSNPQVVSLADVQQWKETGIGRIATLRISELFDIVLQWPASKTALDDLKASVTTTHRRWELTTVFSATLHKRLLNPARSTLDILRVYISMIRTFHALDHSKVLLNRVVPHLQLYLVQREDAVRIVVQGLLASPDEVEKARKLSSSPTDTAASGGAEKKRKLVELAALLNDPDDPDGPDDPDDPDQQQRMEIDDEDLDWNDMNWMPDPADAGVNYRRPRSEDVIGTLISTLGAEDTFIKEFQIIFAQRLLSTQTDFNQEQKLLDLLKKRFGTSALQNCEVMIKDVYDSREVDATFRDAALARTPQALRGFETPLPAMHVDNRRDVDFTGKESQGQVPYHARILSRLYWPNIVQETFNLPMVIVQQQQKYELAYERLKSARRLTWLHQLGQASVEVELEDRTVIADCKTFEAAVVYAFQDVKSTGGVQNGSAHRTVQELQEELQMDEILVIQALEFWESKGVLGRFPNESNRFVVLEYRGQLPDRSEVHPVASAPAVTDGKATTYQASSKLAGPKRAGTTSAMDAKEKERRIMYWQFIVGMLTNSMPNAALSQLSSMMRMFISDGFPWGEQELQEFLAEKVDSGELEEFGGKYKLVKK